jgi:hypothetical protein
VNEVSRTASLRPSHTQNPTAMGASSSRGQSAAASSRHDWNAPNTASRGLGAGHPHTALPMAARAPGAFGAQGLAPAARRERALGRRELGPQGRALAATVGALVGVGAFVASCTVLGLNVHQLITHQTAPGTPASWAATGRGKYDACYRGCDDCDDVNYAANACATTAKTVVPGVLCDGNAMWSWPQPDRYPQLCMEAIGKAVSLANAKQKDRNLLATILPIFVGSVLTGVATYKLISCSACCWGARRNPEI